MLWICFAAQYNGIDVIDIIKSSELSSASHNMRLTESRTARSNCIAFDHTWYSIDTYSRAAMMASIIVDNVLNNMEALQQANRK